MKCLALIFVALFGVFRVSSSLVYKHDEEQTSFSDDSDKSPVQGSHLRSAGAKQGARFLMGYWKMNNGYYKTNMNKGYHGMYKGYYGTYKGYHGMHKGYHGMYKGYHGMYKGYHGMYKGYKGKSYVSKGYKGKGYYKGTKGKGKVVFWMKKSKAPTTVPTILPSETRTNFPTSLAPTNIPSATSTENIIIGGPTFHPTTLVPTNNPTAKPIEDTDTRRPTTEQPTRSLASQDKLVTCISVIDEAYAGSFGTRGYGSVDGTRAQLQDFRTKELTKDRKICLLQVVPCAPGYPIYPDDPSVYEHCGVSDPRVAMLLPPPAEFEDLPRNIYAQIARDDKNVTEQPGDGSEFNVNYAPWYDICNLDEDLKNGLTKVVLFIDDSGSMNKNDVDKAWKKFKADAKEKGFEVVDKVETEEKWLEPCKQEI